MKKAAIPGSRWNMKSYYIPTYSRHQFMTKPLTAVCMCACAWVGACMHIFNTDSTQFAASSTLVKNADKWRNTDVVAMFTNHVIIHMLKVTKVMIETKQSTGTGGMAKQRMPHFTHHLLLAFVEFTQRFWSRIFRHFQVVRDRMYGLDPLLSATQPFWAEAE